MKSSLIRQKGESKSGGKKKTKHGQILSGVKKCSFFGKFAVLCFLVTSFLDSPFSFITNEMSNISVILIWVVHVSLYTETII